MTDSGDERIRVDKWLWAARFFKTRSLAADAVESGKVLLNGARIKPAKGLHVGDELQIRTPGADYTVQVTTLSDKRGSAALAALLFQETAESRARREAARASRPPRDPSSFIQGRPTKRARRQLDRLRDDPDAG